MHTRTGDRTGSLSLFPVLSLHYRRYEAEYEEAKRRTKEALHPLRVELMDVEDQVRATATRSTHALCAIGTATHTHFTSVLYSDHGADGPDLVQEGGRGAQRRADPPDSENHRHCIETDHTKRTSWLLRGCMSLCVGFLFTEI